MAKKEATHREKEMLYLLRKVNYGLEIGKIYWSLRELMSRASIECKELLRLHEMATLKNHPRQWIESIVINNII